MSFSFAVTVEPLLALLEQSLALYVIVVYLIAAVVHRVLVDGSSGVVTL